MHKREEQVGSLGPVINDSSVAFIHAHTIVLLKRMAFSLNCALLICTRIITVLHN